MYRSRRSCFTAVAALALALSAAPVSQAWDDEGHMTVAYLAYQQLSGPLRARADTLLKLNPFYNQWLASIPAGASAADTQRMIFMIAATWPDQIKSNPQYTNDGESPSGPNASQNIGYADKLQHRYWHFVDTPFSPDGTRLAPSPNPNAGTRIAVFRRVLASSSMDALKSYDLVWLLHLVGDVHQPLHDATRFTKTQPHGDRGGNAVKLCAPPCKNELHAFWDDLLGTAKDPGSAIKLGNALPPPDATLARVSDENVWINESFTAAQKSVYVPPIGVGGGPFTIAPGYQTAARALASQRVALGGARLANVLNNELK